MKNYARFFVLTLAAMFAFTACDSSGDDSPPPPENNVAEGVMTEKTAADIFDYEPEGSGVKIKKLKSVDALANYMAAANQTARRGVSFGPNRVSGGKGVFFLNKIGTRFVVSIGDGAFTPGAGEKTLAAIGIKSFKLPEKLARIEPDAFTGQTALSLVIPETISSADVVTAIKEAADKADLPEPKTEEEAADPDNPDDSEDYSLKISGKRVYKTDGSEFTGSAVLYAVSDVFYDEERDWKDVGEVGKIENGILTLSLPELPPAQFDNEPWGGRSIEYFYIMENGVQQRVALELLKAGSVKMTQGFVYISDVNKYNSINEEWAKALDLNAGWNICHEEIWQGPEDAPLTLEEYEAAGYKWVYTDNLLAGTFIKYANEHDDGNLVADKYTFTPDAFKTQGNFSHETTFKSGSPRNCNGTYSINIEKGELTFTPNPETGSGTLTRMLNTAVNGAVIEPLGGDEKNDGGGVFGLYLKDDSFW